MIPRFGRLRPDIGAGVGGVAQAGASVIDTEATNAMNLEMQQRSNAFNAQQADLSRTFSAQQAALNRSFQDTEQTKAEAYNTEMSNTQVQRRLADLKAAGVNPLLAASQLGGASSPSMGAPAGSIGSSAQAASVAPPRMESAMGPLADLALKGAQVANTQQNTKLQMQQARSTEYQADQLAVDTSDDMLMRRSQYLQDIYSMAADQARIVAQTRNLVVAQTEGQDLKNVNQTIQNNIDRLDYTGKQALFNEMIATQTALMRAEGTQATNLTAVEQGKATPYGKAADAIAYLQALHAPISSAVSTLNKVQYPTEGR